MKLINEWDCRYCMNCYETACMGCGGESEGYQEKPRYNPLAMELAVEAAQQSMYYSKICEEA